MLNELADKIHENAVAHGWWDEERNFGEIIALCHSELSEALEEARTGRPLEYFLDSDVYDEPLFECDMTNHVDEKTEGIAVELGDCIIRILDYLATTGIDIDGVIARRWRTTKADRTSTASSFKEAQRCLKIAQTAIT